MDIEEFSKNYFGQIKELINQLDLEKIQKITEVIYDAFKNDKQIFIIGNGGSASTASHFACDLGKGPLKNFDDDQEKRFRVISLTDNVATMIAFANDLSFEDIFIQQLKNLVNLGDVVIGISASGNSANIIKAIEYAKRRGAKTIGLLGFRTGGKLANLVDYEITVQDEHYGRSEDIHLIIVHLITNYLAEELKNKAKII